MSLVYRESVVNVTACSRCSPSDSNYAGQCTVPSCAGGPDPAPRIGKERRTAAFAPLPLRLTAVVLTGAGCQQRMPRARRPSRRHLAGRYAALAVASGGLGRVLPAGGTPAACRPPAGQPCTRKRSSDHPRLGRSTSPCHLTGASWLVAGRRRRGPRPCRCPCCHSWGR